MNKRPNEIDRRVGENLREIRIEKKVSQELLGSQIGVTFQQVQKYEKGTNRISAGRLLMISEALDVGLSEFFEVRP